MPQTISPGFKKLMREPAYCQLATLMPDGAPQNTQVWVETDGEHILVNTAEGRQKVNNVRRDPRVALNVVDPTNA
jgi:PPOX class probable F420-dependent enzyme